MSEANKSRERSEQISRRRSLSKSRVTTEGSNPDANVVSILFLGVLTVALDIALVTTVLPVLREVFGLDERSVSWVLGVFVLATLVGLPLMARLSDVYGRATVYLVDVGLFAVGALVVVLAPSFEVLLVGRAIQGVGASGMFPVASAVIGDVFPQERRGRALGMLGAVYGLAFIMGPILGGILVQYGWTWPFVFNLMLAVVVIIVSVGRLPNTRAANIPPLDMGGLVALGVMLGTLAYGLNQLDAARLVESVLSLRVWPFLVLAGVLVPVFITIEKRAPAPLLRLSLMTRRQVVLASCFAAGAGLIEAAFVFFADYAATAFGVPARTASYMLLPLVVAVAVGSPLAGRMLDRVGSRLMILAGTFLTTLGMFGMAFVATTPAWYYGASVFIGLGLACLLGSALSYILLNEAEAGERTVAQGIITLFISIGQLLGAALIGAVAASVGSGAIGYRRAFLMIALIGSVLVLLSFGLKHRRAEQQAVAS